MTSESERIAALETHYVHVDKTLVAINGTVETIRTDIADMRVDIKGMQTEIAGLHREVADVREDLGGQIAKLRDDMGGEIAKLREEVGSRFEGIRELIVNDRLERSQSKFKVALKVIGWFASLTTVVIGAIAGGLFVLLRFVLPKLVALAHESGLIVT